jgi:hypothetical protein
MLSETKQFDASPAPESELGITLQHFQASNDPNITNVGTYIDIFGELLISRLTPALWFMGTGVSFDAISRLDIDVLNRALR